MASGDYYLPTPLDYELLKRMPREGTTLGDFHVLAMTVSYVVAELNKAQPKEVPKLTAVTVAGRCRAMFIKGYCVKVAMLSMGRGRNHGWQRTLAGEAFYEEQTGKKLDEKPPASLSLVEGGQS